MLRFFVASPLGSCSSLNLPGCNVGLGGAIGSVINALLLVVGALSVIFLIVGGLLFTTSAGDPGRVRTARETIIYAIIGLILSISAFALISFINGSL